MISPVILSYLAIALHNVLYCANMISVSIGVGHKYGFIWCFQLIEWLLPI